MLNTQPLRLHSRLAPVFRLLRFTPDHVLADRSCSSRPALAHLRRRRIPHTIPEKRDQAGHRLRRGSAGGHPQGFDRERYKVRHRIECRIGLQISTHNRS